MQVRDAWRGLINARLCDARPRIGGRVVAPLIVRREDVNYWTASERCCVRGISRDRINCRELGFKGRAGERRVARVLSPAGRDINPRDSSRTRLWRESISFPRSNRAVHEAAGRWRSDNCTNVSLFFFSQSRFEFRRNHAVSRIVSRKLHFENNESRKEKLSENFGVQCRRDFYRKCYFIPSGAFDLSEKWIPLCVK